ncbi:Lipopolysaccharide core heptose(I) kinase RfaP [Anaerohalosphaera lusitana]|uniref:Lipopolysaccharide core heptose(I) kinase RfaP n=1 Tax=Anaerohalosphaera lusitana TaxID=1936003 RepID=A0A1U9NNM6_9BACT|nr:lipopolysaccharide kinase InaA family protein [Anaerohalosphaera lusitana]AQT69552.1 Lipopolysaccharide core heptose(I) kinase RfaP [Anaerohalosphaera lusitana]
MRNIQFAGKWREFFSQQGVVEYEDFFEFDQEQVVNQNTKRMVAYFTLGRGENRREFFIKRFKKPHFKDTWFAFRNFRTICSQGRLEWLSARTLLDNGIGTYIPVCYGSDMKGPFEESSFFITEKLAGQCLADICNQRWEQLQQNEKEMLITHIGRLARRIHDAGISMPDLYVWHIFVDTDSAGNQKLSVIDLHRMKVGAKLNRQLEFARNLGAFDFSMRSEYFDDHLREIFFQSYVGDGIEWDQQQFRTKINARSAVLASRRRRVKY